MILSKTSEHALRVAIRLAAEERGRFVPVHQIAELAGAPYHHLAKICQRLVQAGIVEARKGPSGGLALARPAREISLFHVVEAVAGQRDLDRCVLGLERCGAETPCPLHEEWAPIKERIRQVLRDRSLGDFAARLADGTVTLRAAMTGR